MNMAATGANSIPLGKPNPGFGHPVGGRTSNESMLNAAREAAARIAEKRRVGVAAQNHEIGDGMSKKKRRSRWEQPTETKPPVPTVLPPNLTPDQEKQFLLHLQIEELSRRLRTGDLGIPPNPEDRSPSPEPIYNTEGKRLNTREYRTRKKIEEERHKHIQEALTLNTEYKPPADYKPPVQRVSDRVMIPQDKHPDINFVGLLIGPRGNTLKKMEKETGAKIMIRGKGSVKEGKVGRKDGQPLPGEDEPLHALVTANNAESVKKAVDQINEIIKQGIETPEGQNDLRRMQLRELAKLNGTLREDDTIRCTNCGASSHRTWQCPERQNITNTVVCTNCGGTGHIAADCRQRRDGGGGGGGGGGGFGPQNTVDKAKMDSEYLSLMAELGEGPPPPVSSSSSSHNHPSGPRPLLSTPISNHPPPLMSQNAPPPWMNKDKPPSLMENRPPSLLGSGPNQPPPSLMSQQVQPPNNMPPPPPPSGMSNQSWAQPPPAPPTSMAGPVPPPPPPSLLAAPPPPPPSSEPPPPPQPTSQPWQIQTSSAPSLATTNAGAPPPWYQTQGSSHGATTTVSASMPPLPPWQAPGNPSMGNMPPWHQPPPPPMPPPQPPSMMHPHMQPGMPPPPVQPPLPPGPPPPPPMGMMPYGQPPPPPPPVDVSQGMGAVPPLLPPAPPPPPPN
ncbi:splicing factor 1-like isoform X2 [Glandiceps talaboti]